MKAVKYLLIIAILASAAACRKTGQAGQVAEAETSATDYSKQELPLPIIPPNITDRDERASYIIMHFWDSMDFRDTKRSHNRDFMEQNFANYVSLFTLANKQDVSRSIGNLLSKVDNDTATFNLVRDISYKYLYDPNSPMLNEDYYALFLQPLIADKNTDEASRQRYIYQQQCIAKNRSGMQAADFSYTDKNGKKHTLQTTPCANRMMLMFIDPECDECHKTIEDMKKSQQLNKLIDEHKVTVLAICAEGDKEKWAKATSELPSSWLIGYDNSGIEDNDIYVLRAMPTIYILDSQKRVVLKDVLLESAITSLLTT
jgi:hypothetical protein